MRKFNPNLNVIEAINSFDGNTFRVTELRDAYAQLFKPTKSKSDLRRWCHGLMRTYVKNDLLEQVKVDDSSVMRYRATDCIDEVVSNNSRTAEQSDFTDSINLVIRDRLKQRESEILQSLGATEEIKELKTSLPEISDQLDAELSKLQEMNMRTLGKIEALERLLKCSK